MKDQTNTAAAVDTVAAAPVAETAVIETPDIDPDNIIAAGVIRMNDTQVEVTLKKPVKHGDNVISSVIVREPTESALRGLSLIDVLKMESAALTILIPRVTTPTLHANHTAALSAADRLKLGLAIQSFFGDVTASQNG